MNNIPDVTDLPNPHKLTPIEELSDRTFEERVIRDALEAARLAEQQSTKRINKQ
jgi:hypothetical protein